MKFDFEEINLIPKLCVVDSRNECDTSIVFGKHKFKLPIVPSNMESVINESLAIKLAQNGYFYIMHRFDIDVIKFISNMKKLNLITSISIGVNQDSYNLIDELIGKNLIPDYITIDIAHGHALKMQKILEFIKSKNIQSFIIAGNISTKEGVEDLIKWGADCIKVGIGPGCFTPNSLVKTKNGLKSLIDISTEDYVLTHSGNFKKVLKKHYYKGEQDLLKINNLTPCTENHEFYVIDKSKKDFITETNISEHAFWVKAKDLNKNKHLLVKM